MLSSSPSSRKRASASSSWRLDAAASPGKEARRPPGRAWGRRGAAGPPGESRAEDESRGVQRRRALRAHPQALEAAPALIEIAAHEPVPPRGRGDPQLELEVARRI